jgi:hypothetical protein
VQIQLRLIDKEKAGTSYEYIDEHEDEVREPSSLLRKPVATTVHCDLERLRFSQQDLVGQSAHNRLIG